MQRSLLHPMQTKTSFIFWRRSFSDALGRINGTPSASDAFHFGVSVQLSLLLSISVAHDFNRSFDSNAIFIDINCAECCDTLTLGPGRPQTPFSIFQSVQPIISPILFALSLVRTKKCRVPTKIIPECEKIDNKIPDKVSA